MSTKERILFLSAVISVVLLTIYNSANADDWGYYYDDPIETYNVYPTIPGTDMRDYSQPGYRIEADRYGNERGYPTIPGTDMRDYSQPGYRIDRR